jgi:hypothetical protein
MEDHAPASVRDPDLTPGCLSFSTADSTPTVRDATKINVVAYFVLAEQFDNQNISPKTKEQLGISFRAALSLLTFDLAFVFRLSTRFYTATVNVVSSRITGRYNVSRSTGTRPASVISRIKSLRRNPCGVVAPASW